MTCTPDKPSVGRPSLYSAQIAAEICTRIRCGWTVAKICAQTGMPSARVFYRWADKNPDFGQMVARAREDGTHALVDFHGLRSLDHLTGDTDISSTWTWVTADVLMHEDDSRCGGYPQAVPAGS